MPADQLNGSSTPGRRSTVTSVELDRESVLYDAATESIHQLNAPATLVWACLDGVGSLDDLIDDIVAASGADGAVVRGDVLALVRQFAAQGLLEDAGDEGRDHD